MSCVKTTRDDHELVLQTGASWFAFRRLHPHVASVIDEIGGSLLCDLEDSLARVHPGDLEEIGRQLDDPSFYSDAYSHE